MMKIICVVPTLPCDLVPQCVPSILNQTVPVSMIVLLHKQLKEGTTAQRVSLILNDGLSHICLGDYDYLLRVDCDTVLEPNFLAVALQGFPDLYGGAGYAMLIKISTFKHLLNGKFNSVSDDTYLFHKFRVEGAKTVKLDERLVQTRAWKSNKTNNMYCGEVYYRIGYEPLHVLGFLRNPDLKMMSYVILGYFCAFIKRLPKFDFAPRIWHYQLRRLIPF
jgi:cellulose synthase/poly-beta-1,6-N-acetylglucosamine synthase-like glycosyltransferase